MDIRDQDRMNAAIWESEKGIFLRVVVRPNSREKNFVAEINPEVIVVNLRSPAREGKANWELVKRLAKKLMISSSSITLVAGHKSKEKTLLIDGLNPEEIENRLSSVT